MRIVKPDEFDFDTFEKIPYQKRKRGNPGTRSKLRYKDIVTAFDIETTRIVEIEQSIMYIWQWAIDDVCVIGRTWEEFLEFSKKLSDRLGEKEKLVIFVHNLSYEFTFLKGIYEFTTKDIFSLDGRKILKCTMYGNLEFRCSYLHSNMNLEEYLDKMGVEHQKLELDYNKRRFPWTQLSDQELSYCINDVIGLVEAVKIEMMHDSDNLYTFPLTSTGYVRRDAKACMRKISHLWVKKQLPNFHIFTMLREAFRGGNTHANRYFAGRIVEDVAGYDRSSSYPDVILNKRYPIAQFIELGSITKDEFEYMYRVTHRAILMRVGFTNIRLRDDEWGCPYLSKDKSRNIEKGVYDNGRILIAEYLETTITDVDYSIIEEEYIWDDIYFLDVAYSRYGELPKAFKELVIEYYRRKTELKGVEGEDLNYLRAKMKLNSIYGMMVQNNCKPPYIYEDGLLIEDPDADIEKLLEKDNKTRQLPPYHIGVWVTAHARKELEEAMLEIRRQGGKFIYADTDSVKYIGEVDWNRYNRVRIRNSKHSGAYATDPKGITHYMGMLEEEFPGRVVFSTLGSKKYCYVDSKGKLHLTVSGVIKTLGARELENYGGIYAFKPNFIFRDAGGLEAVYNDHPCISEYNIEGHTLKITSNVVLRPTTYTLGITSEYEYLLYVSGLQDYVDVF